MKPILVTVFCFIGLLCFPSFVGSEELSEQNAPPLRTGSMSGRLDLGEWDDIALCKELESLILRREDTLYSMIMTKAGEREELVTSPILDDSRIQECVVTNDRIWLFLESRGRFPFAIDAKTGETVEFVVPERVLSPKNPAKLESRWVVPTAVGAIVKVSGGDPRLSSERSANNDFFWMSLETGKTVRLPSNWSLKQFSMDRNFAVFSFGQLHVGVDMKTGEVRREISEAEMEVWVTAFDAKLGPVLPLRMKRREQPSKGDVSAISVDGKVILVDGNDGAVSSLWGGSVRDGFAGFFMKRILQKSVFHDKVERRNYFCIADLHGNEAPEVVGRGFWECSMLEEGNCVFVKSALQELDPTKIVSQAFYRSYSGKETWNILEGVQPISQLPEAFNSPDFYQPESKVVLLVEGVGAKNSSVLCVISYRQYRSSNAEDRLRQALEEAKGSVDRTALMAKREWRRTLLITSHGERYMTDLFREGKPPEDIWFHNAGAVFFTSGGGEKLKLEMVVLEHFK